MNETAPDEKEKFLLSLFPSHASILELESLEQLGAFDFRIIKAEASAAMIECKAKNARLLILRTGGSFKLARVLANNLKEALEKVSLPFYAKFDWTISAYDCSSELFTEARQGVQELLKAKGLGKSKFVEPPVASNYRSKSQITAAELKSTDIRSRILKPGDGREGIDFVLHGNLDGKSVYAQTIETSDIQGFDERDFMRPNQDPSRTLSPRIARMLTNIVTISDKMSLLDPFCGLGTILQEGLLCGHSVIGIDKNQLNIVRCKENLLWTKTRYAIDQANLNLFAYDARRLSRARMPRVDAIASEPILLPTFKTNPSPAVAMQNMQKVYETYERSVREFSSVLTRKKCRFALMTPVLIDSSGRRRCFSIEEVAARSGFRPYRGRISGRDLQYPLEIRTAKKRIVQRALNAYFVS